MRKIKVTWVFLTPPHTQKSMTFSVPDDRDVFSDEFELLFKRSYAEPIQIINIQELSK